MTQAVNFKVSSKQMAGKGASRSARRQGLIPAILYGNNEQPQMLAVNEREFLKEYLKGGIKTRLVNLDIDGKAATALVHEIALHPVSDAPLHIDFLRVGKDTQVKVKIAVKLTGEEKAPGVKKGGVLNVVSRYIEMFCNPANIPHHIDIDVSNLDIGQNVHINELALPEGASAVDKTNFTVVSITGRASDEPAAAPTA